MITTITDPPPLDNGSYRVESGSPTGLRWARDPAIGKCVLQAAYQWSDGKSGGFEWRDVETVDVPALQT